MNNSDKPVPSKGNNKFMSALYICGAVVIFVGALFKLFNWPGSILMLILGSVTEVIVLFFHLFYSHRN